MEQRKKKRESEEIGNPRKFKMDRPPIFQEAGTAGASGKLRGPGFQVKNGA